MKKYKNFILATFKELAAYNTQSDEESTDYPSTKSQLEFGQLLMNKCSAVGLKNISCDNYGYITAELPSNTEISAPTIGFISHMDTSPDCSGENIKPQITENYNGEEIKLKNGVIISPKEFPVLLKYKGDTIITADGTTLLGADDKAGIAEILTAMQYFKENPNIRHKRIKIAFTPDEEIGKGVDHFDVKKFGCDFAYTIDGGEIGELNYETFNAARAVITITGKGVHPGHAKGIMKNSSLIALEYASLLPNNEIPSKTENREGFFHLTSIKGNVEKTTLNYIIRAFDKNEFEERKKIIKKIAEKINRCYGNCVEIDLHDEYYNMYEILKYNMTVVKIAEEAMKAAGIQPLIQPVRGGTDGSRLSFMNLPCPNIFAGGHNFHGPYEFVPLESMLKAAEVITNICKI